MIRDEIRLAIASHGHWRARFREAALAGSDSAMLVAASRDDWCEVGRWLNAVRHDDAEPCEYYRRCVALHSQVHKEAARVAILSCAGDKQALLARLDPPGPFNALHEELTLALVLWAKESCGCSQCLPVLRRAG